MMISAEQFKKFFDDNLSPLVDEKMGEIQGAEKKELRIAAVLWILAGLCLLFYILSRSMGFDLIDGFAGENRKYWLYAMFAFIGVWVISLLFAKSDELFDALDKEVYTHSAPQFGLTPVDAKAQFQQQVSAFNVLRQMAAAQIGIHHVGFTTKGYVTTNVSLTLEANEPELMLAFERSGMTVLEVELSATQERSSTDGDDNEETERTTKSHFSGLIFMADLATKGANFCLLPDDIISDKDGGGAELEKLLLSQLQPCSIDGYLLLSSDKDQRLAQKVFDALDSEPASLGKITHKYIQFVDGQLLVMAGFEQRPLCNGVCGGNSPAEDIYSRLDALCKLQSSLIEIA